MDRLILMRHAKAERRAPGGDFERALAESGREDAAIMARVLAKEGLVPDLALVSAALRTTQTWQAMAPFFPGARMESRRGLYNAGPGTLLEAAEEAGGNTVLVIAHNPGIHELAVHLLVEGGASAAVVSRAASRFPTATAAAFQVDAGGRPTYDGLFFVADHGGGDGE